MLRLLVFALAAHVSCGSQFLFEMYTKEVDDTSPLMDENIFSQFLEDLGFENPLAAKCEVFKPPKNFRLNAKKFKKAFRKFKLQDYVVPHELENKLEQSIFHKFSKDRRWIEKEEFANFINNSHIYVTEFVEVALTNPLKLPYEIDFDSFLGELRSIARETNVKLSNIMQKVLKATRVLRVQDRCSRNIDTEEGDKSNRPQEEPNGDLPTLRFYDAYLTLRQPGKRVYHMNEAVFTQFLEDAGVNDVLATKCKVLKNVRHVGGDKKAGFKLGFPDFQNALDKILECPNPTSPFDYSLPSVVDLHPVAEYKDSKCITNVLQRVSKEEKVLQLFIDKIFGKAEKIEFAEFAKLINNAEMDISDYLSLKVLPKGEETRMTIATVVKELRNLAVATKITLEHLLSVLYTKHQHKQPRLGRSSHVRVSSSMSAL